jgi:hypothetical protein
MSKGFTSNEALKAYQAIDYSVMKQSTVLSYGYFLVFRVLFFVLYSHYFFIKKGQNKFKSGRCRIINIKMPISAVISAFFYSNENYYPSEWFLSTN